MEGAVPKYLEKRRRRWYAVLDIPRDLREFFGKARFKESLQTDSQREAEQRVHGVVGQWKGKLEAARKVLASGCPHEQQLVEYREIMERLNQDVRASDEQREIMEYSIQDYAEHHLEPVLGRDAAELWFGRATGRVQDLDHLSGQWLASLSCERKSLTMHRQAIGLLLEHHKVADTVNRRSASHFVEHVLSVKRQPSTVKRMVSTYKTFWEWMANRGHLGEDTKNPWERQGPSSRPSRRQDAASTKQERRGFTESEGAQMLAAIDAHAAKFPADGLSARLLATTGMRIEEVCSLAVEDVTELPREVAGGESGGLLLRVRQGKTKSAVRSVPLLEEQTVGLLRNRLRTLQEDAGALFPEYPPNQYGDRYNALSKRLGRRLRSLSDDPGLTGAHSWRHRAKGLLERAGVRLSVQDQFLGHASPGVGLGTYYKATLEELVEAAKAMHLPEQEGIKSSSP